MSDPTGVDSYDPQQYEFDPRPSDILPVPSERFSWDIQPSERVAVIRTSDRATFKRCRRRWAWSSHLRGNLGPNEGQSPLWMGSGFHFALEDFHGEKRFNSPAEAFTAYVDATKRHDKSMLPADWQDLHVLAVGMLSYYSDEWLIQRPAYRTYVHNGVPQVEVNFRVNIPFDQDVLHEWGYDRVVYSGTLDRVIEDDDGLLWIVEYKTAKTIQTVHLDNDAQCTSYCWAGNLLYGRPIAGVIYQQHRKDLPQSPRVLTSGKLSTDQRQLTTHRAFRRALINQYGSAENAPKDYVDFLWTLAKDETPNGDKFILRTKTERNQHQCEAEGVKILMETSEMLNPDLLLYPNPMRDCKYFCPFQNSCVAMDSGDDWEYDLKLTTKAREPVYDSWRSQIQWPDTKKYLFLEPNQTNQTTQTTT